MHLDLSSYLSILGHVSIFYLPYLYIYIYRPIHLFQDKDEFWMTKAEYEEKGLQVLNKLGPRKD